jgi:cyanophycin synthetase
MPLKDWNAGIGDRRDEDIRECATIENVFDHIIIRQEKYLRGRTEEEIINLILEGPLQVKT